MRTPPPRDDLRFSNTTGILQKKTMWFIGVEVEQETSAPPPKKNPGPAPGRKAGSCRRSGSAGCFHDPLFDLPRGEYSLTFTL